MGDGKDGRIHTDSATKIITLLLYMNPGWEMAEGRLRLLRGPADLDDYVREVTPLGRHDAGVPAQRAVVSRPSAPYRPAPDIAAQLGDGSRRGPARARPASLVGAAEGAEPVPRRVLILKIIAAPRPGLGLGMTLDRSLSRALRNGSTHSPAPGRSEPGFPLLFRGSLDLA